MTPEAREAVKALFPEEESLAEAGEEKPTPVQELAERIKSLKATNMIEAVPQRFTSHNVSTAETPSARASGAALMHYVSPSRKGLRCCRPHLERWPIPLLRK